MTDQQEHPPRHRAVGDRADRLAVFRRHAADGEAAAGSSSSTAAAADSSSRRSRQRRPPARRRRRRSRRARPPARRTAGRRPADAPAGQALTRDAVLAASPAHRDRDAAAARLDRAQGRPHRRPRADAVPRDGRSEVAARSCCCRRPAARIRSTPSSAGSPAAGDDRRSCPTPTRSGRQQGAGTLDVGRPVTLDLGQRRGPGIPPHHRGRRQVPVHRRGRGRRTRARRRSRSIPTR